MDKHARMRARTQKLRALALPRARARTHTHTHSLSHCYSHTHESTEPHALLRRAGSRPPPFPSPAVPLALLRRARLHGRFRPSRAIHGPVPAWWGPPWAGSSPVGSSMGRFRPIRAPRGPVPALNLPLSCGGRGRGGGRPRGVARRTRPTCRCRAAGAGSTRHGSRGRVDSNETERVFKDMLMLIERLDPARFPGPVQTWPWRALQARRWVVRLCVGDRNVS